MSTTVLTIIIAVLVLAVALFVLRAVPTMRAYTRFKGKRLITCPETNRAAAVDVAAGEAAIGTFLNEPTLRLVECSRWPERQGCGQDCLKQIEIESGELSGLEYRGEMVRRKEMRFLPQADRAPSSGSCPGFAWTRRQDRGVEERPSRATA